MTFVYPSFTLGEDAEAFDVIIAKWGVDFIYWGLPTYDYNAGGTPDVVAGTLPALAKLTDLAPTIKLYNLVKTAIGTAIHMRVNHDEDEDALPRMEDVMLAVIELLASPDFGKKLSNHVDAQSSAPASLSPTPSSSSSSTLSASSTPARKGVNIEEFNADLDKLRAENVSLRTEFRSAAMDANNNIKEFNTDLDRLRAENHSLRTELQRAKMDANKTSIMVESLEFKMATLDARVSAEEGKNKRLQDTAVNKPGSMKQKMKKSTHEMHSNKLVRRYKKEVTRLNTCLCKQERFREEQAYNVERLEKQVQALQQNRNYLIDLNECLRDDYYREFQAGASPSAYSA